MIKKQELIDTKSESWIRCAERQPNTYYPVWATDGLNEFLAVLLPRGTWHEYNGKLGAVVSVTHWTTAGPPNPVALAECRALEKGRLDILNAKGTLDEILAMP